VAKVFGPPKVTILPLPFTFRPAYRCFGCKGRLRIFSESGRTDPLFGGEVNQLHGCSSLRERTGWEGSSLAQDGPVDSSLSDSKYNR